jgi:hypothetical protein
MVDTEKKSVLSSKSQAAMEFKPEDPAVKSDYRYRYVVKPARI